MGEVIEMSSGVAPPPVVVLRRGPVHRITLSSPPANALAIAVADALLAALDGATDDPECRVVVLAAAGKAFSVGHDLDELAAHRSDEDGGRAFFDAAMRLSAGLMQAIVRHPKPVIAEVAGFALGTGCQLVASCDLAIAAEGATFATPGVDTGLLCSASMVALSRNLLPKHAMEMLLTGETIDARTAREFGLVNRVVPPEYLTTVVEKYASAIAAKSPLAVRLGKEAFYSQAEMGLAEAYDYANEVTVASLMGSDGEEGIAAFLAKREPHRRGE